MDSSESSTPGGSKRTLHRGFLTAGAVVAMVLAGLGVAGAQTGAPPTTTDPAQSTAQADEGRKAHCHHKHGPGLKAGLAAAASTIGVSEEELRTALRDGQSIAQVAQSKDVDVQKVIDAMVAEAKAKLAEAVQNGRITQAQADAKAANLSERITTLVNREGLPTRGPGHRHGGRRPPAQDGDAPAAAEPSSATVDT